MGLWESWISSLSGCGDSRPLCENQAKSSGTPLSPLNLASVWCCRGKLKLAQSYCARASTSSWTGERQEAARNTCLHSACITAYWSTSSCCQKPTNFTAVLFQQHSFARQPCIAGKDQLHEWQTSSAKEKTTFPQGVSKHFNWWFLPSSLQLFLFCARERRAARNTDGHRKLSGESSMGESDLLWHQSFGVWSLLW